MNPLGILIIVAGPVLAIVWLVAEFKAQRAWRIALGLLSMVILTTVAVMATLITTQLNYNSYYGFAAKGLIEEPRASRSRWLVKTDVTGGWLAVAHFLR